MRNLLLSTALAALTVLPAWAQSEPTPAPPAAQLKVESIPSGALIFVDREYKGTGKIDLALPAGQHLLRVSAGEEFEPYTRTLDLNDKQPTQLRIQLAPSAKRWLQKARTLMAQGDYQQAQELCVRSRAQMPVESSWWEAIAALNNERNEDAVVALRRYAQYVTDSPELFLLLGRLHKVQGRTGESITAYKNALLLPKALGPDALSGLPSATFENIQAASRPKTSREKLRLAQLLMLKGDNAQSLRWLESAVDEVYPKWEKRDWLKFEPKLPARKQATPVAPEDSYENR